MATMRHHHMSQGEGFPTRLRVFTSNTLALTNPISKASNYTNCINCNLSLDNDNFYGSSFDFEFDRGILYSDYISLNFSLTVDPNARARPGSGAKTAAVVLQPICNVSQHNDSSGDLYPTDTRRVTIHN